jgi:type I restriction enzyme S subunit
LQLAINSQLHVLIEKAQGGVGLQHVTKGTLEALPLPLPPMDEQHRIVAKVDELTARCEQLEKARADRETKRDKLTAATLARLNTPNLETFRDDARFALDNLQSLITRPDLIKQLRQTILSLALSGHFSGSKFWPSAKTRLGDVATLQNGYAFKSEWFSKTGVRLLRNANVSHGVLSWDDVVCLPESRTSEFARFRLQEGDVVLSLDRPFIATGTKVARISREDLPVLLLQRVGRFVCTEALTSDYLLLWIHSPAFTSQVDPGRSNGVPHISSKQVEAAELFVPDVTEQQRVVSKANELLSICDALELALTTRDTKRGKLLEVLLSESVIAQSESMPAAASTLKQQRRAS